MCVCVLGRRKQTKEEEEEAKAQTDLTGVAFEQDKEDCRNKKLLVEENALNRKNRLAGKKGWDDSIRIWE